jgi:putative oxidoreductase
MFGVETFGPRMSVLLQRLFSSFARGWPGFGLLLMRAVTGVVLLGQAGLALHRGGAAQVVALAILSGIAAILLLVGLWTPVIGAVVAGIALLNALMRPGDPTVYILLASIGVALALLGPGAFSIDARLFGLKRIDIRER